MRGSHLGAVAAAILATTFPATAQPRPAGPPITMVEGNFLSQTAIGMRSAVRVATIAAGATGNRGLVDYAREAAKDYAALAARSEALAHVAGLTPPIAAGPSWEAEATALQGAGPDFERVFVASQARFLDRQIGRMRDAEHFGSVETRSLASDGERVLHALRGRLDADFPAR